jgi:hypothetical protein
MVAPFWLVEMECEVFIEVAVVGSGAGPGDGFGATEAPSGREAVSAKLETSRLGSPTPGQARPDRLALLAPGTRRIGMVAFGCAAEGLTYHISRVDLAKDPVTLPPFSAVLRVQAQGFYYL